MYTFNTCKRTNTFIAVFIAILMVIINSVPAYAGASSSKTKGRVNAISYRMNLNLDTKKNCLTETVTIKFKNNTNKSLNSIVIRDMTPAALKYYQDNYEGDSKSKLSTKIQSVRFKGSKKNLKYSLSKANTVVEVNLGKKIRPGRTARVVVRMKTDIPERQDRFGYQKTKDGKLYALSFCFPYLADNKNGKWIKDPYFDDGESRSYDLANYYVKFNAPKSYMVAASGKEKTKKGTTRITALNCRDFAIVASNFMQKDSFKVKGVKVNNYYLKGTHPDQYRKLSKMVAIDSINLFTKKVGRYMYDELDMVECLFGFGFGGMEYPGLIMINGSTYCTGEGHKYGAQSLAEVVTHEIGHQWFYAAVGNREYTEGWIDEGFTTYLEKDIYGLTNNESNKYLRKIDKEVPAISEMKEWQKSDVEVFKPEYKGQYLNVPPHKYDEYRTYGDLEYNGGYIFLLEVRDKMGSRKFDRFLKEYYKKNKNKIVTSKKVAKLIRKYDNSKKMNQIIKYYIKF